MPELIQRLDVIATAGTFRVTTINGSAYNLVCAGDGSPVVELSGGKFLPGPITTEVLPRAGSGLPEVVIEPGRPMYFGKDGQLDFSTTVVESIERMLVRPGRPERS